MIVALIITAVLLSIISGFSKAICDLSESGDMKHVARIPLIVFEQWAKKHGLTPAEMMGPKGTEVIRKELNDPDNSYLRTGMGRI